MALGDERLCKIIGPAGFRALDLDQRSANGFAGGLRLAPLDLVDDVRHPFVHPLFIAWIAAEEEILHVEAIQYDLVAHGLAVAKAAENHTAILRVRAFLQ